MRSYQAAAALLCHRPFLRKKTQFSKLKILPFSVPAFIEYELGIITCLRATKERSNRDQRETKQRLNSSTPLFGLCFCRDRSVLRMIMGGLNPGLNPEYSRR